MTNNPTIDGVSRWFPGCDEPKTFSDAKGQLADAMLLVSQLRARVQELESGRGEPAAYIVEAVDPHNGKVRRRGLHWHSVETLRNTRDFKEWIGENVTREQQLFTAPPAPIAVLLPERQPVAATCVTRDRREGWNACLGATAALNGVKS